MSHQIACILCGKLKSPGYGQLFLYMLPNTYHRCTCLKIHLLYPLTTQVQVQVFSCRHNSAMRDRSLKDAPWPHWWLRVCCKDLRTDKILAITFFSRIKLDVYLAPMDPSHNSSFFFAQACGPSVHPKRTRGDKLKKDVGGGVGRYLCLSDLTP